MKTGILVAMEQEYAALKGTGLPDHIELCCSLSGIGKVNAASAAERMILTECPDIIINSGLAGGMIPEMHTGDLVIASRTAYHDVWCGEGNLPGQVQGLPAYFEADNTLKATAEKVADSLGIKNWCGLVTTGDQFFISLEEDARIRAMYPEVLACDMESAAIAQVCHLHGIPFLSFRIISDVHTSAEVQKADYAAFLRQFTSESFTFLKTFIESL